jgi:hypothetical protein
MNPPKSPSNIGAGRSGLLSAQFLSRQKYHVSLGEFVLSVSHDKRKNGDGVSALSQLSVLSLSKTLTTQIWARDYLSRILHHAMLPALVADKPKDLIAQGNTSSRPRNNSLARFIYLVMVILAVFTFASTRYHHEKAIQLLPETGRTVESSVSGVQEKMTKAIVIALKSSSVSVLQEKMVSVVQEKMTKPNISTSVAVVKEKKTNKTTVIPLALAVLQEKKNTPVLQEKKTKAPQERALKKLRRKLVQLILEATSYTRGA